MTEIVSVHVRDEDAEPLGGGGGPQRTTTGRSSKSDDEVVDELQRLMHDETMDDDDDNVHMNLMKHHTHSVLVPLNHWARGYWDATIILALLFTATVTPFEVSFLQPALSGLFVVNRFVDVIFLLDMGLTIMTPVLDEEKGVWILTNWGIFKKYARFWFWIDLLTVIPFDAVSIAIELQGGNAGNLQGIRLLRLLRLIKLLRVVRVSRIIKRREADMDMKYSTLTLFKFLVIILILMHWISCLMALVPQLEGDSYDDLTPQQIADGEKPFNWIVVYFEGALGMSYGQYNIWTVYLAGCYFAAMTLTTIGYGDVTPKTDAERGVVCLIMLVGATFYAYAIGNICSIIQNMDKIRSEFRQECDEFANFLDAQKFPPDTKQRLKKYIHFTWTKKKAIHHRELLGNLSAALQREIAFELADTWVSRIPFISEAVSPPSSGEYHDLLQEIALKVKPEAYPAGETLLAKNDIVDRLYLIERGSVCAHSNPVKVSAEKGNEGDVAFADDTGSEIIYNSFGEEMIVENYTSPNYVTAVTDVDVLVLTKDDLMEVLERYPATKANIRYLSSRKNWEQFKKQQAEGVSGISFDPEEGEREVVNEIIKLNHELKSLGHKLLTLEDLLNIKMELLKVAKEN